LNKRQLLIKQARAMLRDLTSPAFFDYDSSLVFVIDEVEFEYCEDELDHESCNYE